MIRATGRSSSGRYMLTFSRRPYAGTDPRRSVSVLAHYPRPPRLRWMNFNICPHCRANGRPGALERLNEWGPIISRSDGLNFHPVLGDRPIEYLAERASCKTEMMSAGFWYVHEANGGSTETVVVILRRPPTGGVSVRRHFETVADKLYAKLRKSSRLSCVYEFDGQRLHQVVH
jgi:hypothetical protein